MNMEVGKTNGTFPLFWGPLQQCFIGKSNRKHEDEPSARNASGRGYLGLGTPISKVFFNVRLTSMMFGA